jgi:ribosomal-protein-alanine N-acetyltransferase
MSIPTIPTSRLILRAFTKEDVGPLHRILGEEDVLRYFPNTKPPSQDQVGKLISAQLKHWTEHGYGWWAVEPRRENELIGWSGLQFLPETKEVEVAYLLGKAFWGKGLATEAAQASLQFGFENFELESIVAIVHPENIASQRVIEKLGMSFVDRTHYFGMDCYRYTIDRSSFGSQVVAK